MAVAEVRMGAGGEMMMKRIAIVLGVVPVLVTACGSGGSPSPTSPPSPAAAAASPSSATASPSTSGKIRGCVPTCISGSANPGTVGPGPYTTQFFFGGQMHVTFKGVWESSEDSPGEFNASPKATPRNGVFFWEDVYPVDRGHIVKLRVTASGLLHYLQTSPTFVTSTPTSGKIGKLPATVVDVSLSNKAKSELPGCPRKVCVGFLRFPQSLEDWGIASAQVQRFYLSDVEYGGRRHLLVAAIYPNYGTDMDIFAKVGEQLLRTVRVPAKPA
jgi:hypothetical protein